MGLRACFGVLSSCCGAEKCKLVSQDIEVFLIEPNVLTHDDKGWVFARCFGVQREAGCMAGIVIWVGDAGKSQD